MDGDYARLLIFSVYKYGSSNLIFDNDRPSLVNAINTDDCCFEGAKSGLHDLVSADFEVYGGAVGLISCCLYGGAPYNSQQIKLKRGVEIVVGTPGRIKGRTKREILDLSSLKFRVLDEADAMLRMVF
ncbi:hypothetical protein Vadar_004287 [Vaccinium darrowii]|uniref:Uncharacterized protein n=1 Tax=Vaccinium darrowii TaxID=229202 RepID=A0ACB7XY90_9ERIC|nr:hypothetical protein Vadar_004287 [Vaccinium darrowii]